MIKSSSPHHLRFLQSHCSQGLGGGSPCLVFWNIALGICSCPLPLADDEQSAFVFPMVWFWFLSTPFLLNFSYTEEINNPRLCYYATFSLFLHEGHPMFHSSKSLERVEQRVKNTRWMFQVGYYWFLDKCCSFALTCVFLQLQWQVSRRLNNYVLHRASRLGISDFEIVCT